MTETEDKYYRHFKGGKYRLIGCALDSETCQEMVIYRALYGERQTWVRPKEMFFESITRDGCTFPRFTEISEEEAME